MSEVFYEFGYQLADGREVWAEDYGRDGVWTPYDPTSGVKTVDLTYEGDEDNARLIREALTKAGVTGQVIRRKVTITRGDVEIA